MAVEQILLLIAAVSSLFVLIYNLFIQENVLYKFETKRRLGDVSADFLTYLSDVVSFTAFDGVLTKIRNYSLKIILCFTEGTAPEPLHKNLEHIWQMVRERKTLSDTNEITMWEQNFREKVGEVRINLSFYCGGLTKRDAKRITKK